MPSRRSEILRQVAARIAQVNLDEEDTLPDEALRAIEEWEKHPWNWLSSHDPLNLCDCHPGGKHPLVWTKDEREKDKGKMVKPFPAGLPYLKLLVEVEFREHGDGEVPVIILVDKARQMYVSTATLLYFDWECRFNRNRRILWSKSTEDESKEMLKDKVRTPYAMLPEWVRIRYPMSDAPEARIDYGKDLATRSYLSGVAENVAIRDARGGTASMIGVDEAARQKMFRQIIAAAGPMTDKIICLTTAEIGTDGAECFMEYLKDNTQAGIIQMNEVHL